MKFSSFAYLAFFGLALAVIAACQGDQERSSVAERQPGSSAAPRSVEILNVSYDPTREMYREFNAAFAQHWAGENGQTERVQMSHAGSGSQARAVIDGLDADVVTLALAYDVDAIRLHAERLQPDWQKRLPDNSAPYTSTIVLLVRSGNPKGIRDWSDLVKPGVEVITPNPKTSGGARWNYLAAWGFALEQELGDLDGLDSAPADKVEAAEAAAKAFVRELFHHVPVLDRGARASTNTFVQRGIGDVLLAWENEALLAIAETAEDAFEIVVPSVSILAEPTVALVDAVVDRKGTRKVATAYLEYLYTPAGQDIVAKHYFRPRSAEVLARYADQYPSIKLFTIDEVFGGWTRAQEEHFNDGGIFDDIFVPRAP
jgi:sulfate transport system substrate-binding protein